MIFVIATLKTTEKDKNALLQASYTCIAETRKEPGCLSYDLHASVSDPETLVFVERWRDREDLDAHFQTPHIADFKNAAESLIVESSIEIITPEAVDHL